MQLTKAFLLVILCLSIGNVYAEHPQMEHYVFHYETGDTYDIHLTENTITWKGLEGSDIGLSETDTIKRKQLSNEVEIIQWTEKNSSFVTLVLDRTHHKIVSSGKIAGDEWLNLGEIESV